MKLRGLLHKMKMHIIFIIVLCIQLLGSQQLFLITNVKGAEITGTDSKITITSPVSDIFTNEISQTFTGTVENLPTDVPIILYDDTKKIGEISAWSGNNWSISLELSEGIHSITASADMNGNIVSSNPVTITIDTTPPNILVKKIKVNDDGSTTINGVVSDNLISPDNISMKLVYAESASIKIDQGIITPGPDGSWTVTNKFTDKLNKYFLVASDNQETGPKLFNQTSIPVQRPFITSIKMTTFNFRHKIMDNNVVQGEDETVSDVDLLSEEDMTRVILNPTIKIELSDMRANFSFPIYLYNKSGFVDSAVPIKSNNHLELTFNNPLEPGTTYYLMFNPSLISDKYKEQSGLFVDDVNNKFIPMIKKFTTVSNTVKDTLMDEFTADYENQPHGYYTNNTNTCGNCHSTHVGNTSNLEKKEFADNYCMSCHDGTVAAPLAAPEPEKINSDIKSKHETALVDNNKTKSGSCTSCHNPHLTWSPENPDLLMDHNVYTQTDSTKIDSLNTSCESCHQGDQVQGPKDYHTNSTSEVLSYKKLGSPSGNYSLCLRCHNIDKNINIEKYYNSESLHSITALNGSNLNGPLPCSECHGTHGSNNIKLLKDTLGHEDTQVFTAGESDTKSIKVPIDDKELEFTILSDTKERDLCLTCHNGKTAIYGVKTQKYNETIVEHNDNPTKACSYCHGRGDTEFERALSAAHGPQVGLEPSK